MKFLLVTTVLMSAAALSADLWESPQAWQELHRKMTESQVTDLLGNPKQMETIGTNRIWYYQDIPRQRDGKITWRPKAGFVHFKQIAVNGENLFMLYGWKPPHMEQTLPPPVEDKISPDNPLAQLEQIERLYMEQLQLLDSESLDSPSPAPAQPSRQQQSPRPPAAPGLSLPERFNKIPPLWVFIAIGAIFIVTALVILRPQKRPRRQNNIQNHKDEPPQKPKNKWEVEL